MHQNIQRNGKRRKKEPSVENNISESAIDEVPENHIPQTTIFSRNGTLILTIALHELPYSIKFSKNTPTPQILQTIQSIINKNEKNSSYFDTQPQIRICYGTSNDENLSKCDSVEKFNKIIGNLADNMKSKSIQNQITIVFSSTTQKSISKEEPKIDNNNNSQGKRKFESDENEVDGEESKPSTPSNSSSNPSSPVNSTSEEMGVVGLRNLRNTCFANVVLQSLSNSTPFRLFTQNLPKEVDSSKDTVSCEMKSLLDSMWSGSSTKEISPEKLVTSMIGKGFQYEMGTEEDAAWFLQVLIQTMDEELVSHLGEKYSVSKIFATARRTEIYCTECHRQILHYNEDSTVCTLSLPDSDEDMCTLDACLKASIADGVQPRECIPCHLTNPRIFHYVYFTKLPPILVFHFNRYKWTGQVVRKATRSAAKSKISTHVMFPLQLDLSQFLPTSKNSMIPRYRLAAIIVHDGLTPASGHYFVICWNATQGKWFRFDDHHKPTEFSEKLIHQLNPFMLFYLQTS